MTAWMEPFAFWLADVYLAATLLLAVAAAIFVLVKQPSLRMAVAWGIVPGLLLVACFCLSASRPHWGLWPARPVKKSTAAQKLVTSRRLYAGGLQAAPDARIKTAGVKSAASDPGGIIEGQVVSAESGNPAGGVTIAFESERPKQFVHAIIRTEPDGHYRITSLPEGSFSAWVCSSPSDQTAPVIESLAVHPGRATEAPVMRLVKAGVIEGRIVDEITGKHGAGITVGLQGINWQKGKASSYWDHSVTDADGHYRFASLPAGKFNLFIDDTPLDAAAAAIDSLEMKAGQTVIAPPIRMVRGCLIRGLIIDDATGKGVSLREGDHLDIQSHGPARPRSGAAVQVAEIRKDGTFEIRLPPGDSWLGVRVGESFDYSGKGGDELSVSDASVINVEYHVRRYDPSKEKAAPVQQPLGEHERYSTKIIDYHIAKDEIGGMCLSADEARLKGVEVILYIRSFGRQADNWGAKQIDKTTTNDEGQFVFRHVPQVNPRDADYLTVARRHGRITMFGTLDHRHDWLDLRMPAARPFKGTVKNEQGKPVVGALVRCDGSPFYDLPEGIQSARTNARGEFEIDDVGGAGRCVVEHPDYARKTVEHLPFDEPAELKVRPGGVVEGQVVDTVTGKPASGLSVSIQPINQVPQLKLDDVSFFWTSTRTDSQGRFRIESIPSGQFNVFVSSAGTRLRRSRLVGSPRRRGRAGAPIRLVKPGVVKGRLIDDLTGQPALVGEDERVTIGVHGPSRPWSGVAIEGFAVKTDGTFELRLPPGKNFVYVAGGPFLVRKPGDPSATQDIRQIDVKEGTETTIEFRVIRQVPMKQAPEKPAKKSPASTSGAVTRPAPVMLAEAPSVSPKIVDYHLEKDAVGGLCLGRDEVRFAGVEVALYIIGRNFDTYRNIARTITNDEGQFVFRQVPNLKTGEEWYLFIARKKGLATSEGILQQRHDWVDLLMGPGVSMNGVVRDEQGKPIPGALVSGGSYWHYGVPDEAPSVRTDERGEFQIDDLPQFGACSVSHPDYVSAGFGRAKKNPVVATLRKGSVVEGQVIDGDTGQPVADALVSLETLGHFAGGFAPWGRRAGRGGIAVTTDRNGRYKFRPVGPGTFNLSFRGGLGGVASAAIDALKVGRQQTVEVPPIRLAKGATVTVRLVFNDRSQDISMGPEETVVIGIRSGEASAVLTPSHGSKRFTCGTMGRSESGCPPASTRSPSTAARFSRSATCSRGSVTTSAKSTSKEARRRASSSAWSASLRRGVA